MGVFTAEGLSKSFGERLIFQGVNLELRRGDRVGLIGPNGSGKTTLLRCLLGLEHTDQGRVILPADERIGYVEQEASLDEQSLYQELLKSCRHLISWQRQIHELELKISREQNPTVLNGLMEEYARLTELFERGGGYEYQNTIRRVAAGLGFNDADLERSARAFSGGQKTRIALARALIGSPDYLFLDEPTNHLDLEMIEWLEQFLVNYPGGVLVISHDRYFLNQVVGRILELSSTRLTSYRGNYDDYLSQSRQRREAQQNAYEKQQALITKTEEYIRKYRAGIKSRQARGRQSQLERLKLVEAPARLARIDFHFPPPPECADEVAELDRVTAAYGEHVIFEDVSLLVRKGDRLALVGPNGSGKTTLLKLILGELKPSKGRARLGSRVIPGYYSQEHEGLHQANNIIDEITLSCGLTEELARHYLAAFLFKGDDIYKEIGSLSGGEEARLVLLKLILTGANFLILDEPTNHLDIPTKETMEEAILNFPGTYLIVSHDRYFLDKVATRVFELDQGRLTAYHGHYSYYRQRKMQLAAACQPATSRHKQEKREHRPQRKKRPSESRVLQLEQEIASLEQKQRLLEARINDPASYATPDGGRELAEDYARLRERLDSLYQEWLTATGDD